MCHRCHRYRSCSANTICMDHPCNFGVCTLRIPLAVICFFHNCIYLICGFGLREDICCSNSIYHRYVCIKHAAFISGNVEANLLLYEKFPFTSLQAAPFLFHITTHRLVCGSADCVDVRFSISASTVSNTLPKETRCEHNQ